MTQAQTDRPFGKEKPEPRKVSSSKAETNSVDRRSIAAPDSGAGRYKRLASLDAFRGFTIALMIVVNSPGEAESVFAPLRHADWNGWTFADTVFPSFLFIVGVSLVYSFAKQQEGRIVLRILKRTLILFALGLFVNAFPTFELSTLRIPGVLQRIALCYFFASLIVLRAGPRGCILWLIGLLASYWLMMEFIPVPGVGTGVLEPGRNFAAWVDSHLLKGYMWSYYNGAWDPEGVASTIPAIATTLFGVLTGQWLRSSFSDRRKVAGMVCAGLVLLIAGTVLDRWMPINKSIWTSTFSIFMAGLALVSLAFFHWSIDMSGFPRWPKPLIILGLNPITIYVLSIILDTTLRSMNLAVSGGKGTACRFYLFKICLVPTTTSEVASLLYALVILSSMFLVAWIMWRKRIFIRI
jgi:predicted acyltransferase